MTKPIESNEMDLISTSSIISLFVGGLWGIFKKCDGPIHLSLHCINYRSRLFALVLLFEVYYSYLFGKTVNTSS